MNTIFLHLLKKLVGQKKLVWQFALLAMVAALSCQTARAQLLAYEPFEYEAGDILDVASGELAGGTGWHDLLGEGSDGWSAALGSWGQYDPNRILISDVPVGWGYTDSRGNSLPVSGRAVNITNWEGVNRYVDLSDIDPNLLVVDAADPTPKMGVDGTEVWISFLGQGTEESQEAFLGFGESHEEGGGPFGFNRSIKMGRPYKLTIDNIGGDSNNAWGVTDTAPAMDPTAVTGNSYDEKVFFVARINFGAGATLAGGIAGDDSVDIWTNPDLGATAPADGDRNIGDFLFWTKDFNAIQLGGNAGTLFDEIRIGLTYADVAPIATASGADFDSDSDVDGNDFLDWQRNFGGTLNATDLANWQSEFGNGVGLLGAVSAVPEPATFMLVSMAMALVAGQRPTRWSPAL